MDSSISSPIPWPASDKKRKPTGNLYTPENKDATPNKLSTKKTSGKKIQFDTPKRPVTKWLKASRSSIETFHRVYNEMTSSPTDRLSSSNDRNFLNQSLDKTKQTNESQINGFSVISGKKELPDSRLNKELSACRIIDSDSDSFPSQNSSSTCPGQEKLSDLPKKPNQGKYFTDSSSDDDSFHLPPPLHQRIPLISTGNTPPSGALTSKLKPATLFGQQKGKENVESCKHKSSMAMTIHDSSSEDEFQLPDLDVGETRQDVCGFLLSGNNSNSRKQNPSFSAELENMAATATNKHKPFFKKETHHQNLTPKSVKPKVQYSVPKSFKSKSVLSSPKPSTNLDLSLEIEPAHLIKTDTSKMKSRRIILDSSSENESFDLPDIDPKKMNTPKPLSSYSVHKKSILPTPKTTQSGTQKLWISPEMLRDSCRFLKSLSEVAPVEHSSAHFRNKFSLHKDELVKQLYLLYNNYVFENKLPADMSITWNVRLTKTAGYCYMRSHRDLTRSARIELSTKVLTSAERVRDTLLHELCHAAAFIIHGYRDGHGPLFKFWGQKAGVLFPFLPVVSRCHTYSINTKYVYKCTRCKGMIGRHSKSLDISRKVCGRCGGRFELLVNGVENKSTPRKKTPEFAKYVKQNYKDIKNSNQKMKHGDIMQKLGEMFTDKAKILK